MVVWVVGTRCHRCGDHWLLDDFRLDNFLRTGRNVCGRNLSARVVGKLFQLCLKTLDSL